MSLRLRWPLLVAAASIAVAITYLTATVSREIRAFDNSQHSTAQWSLSQTEIELLALIATLRADPPNLTATRLRYDVFYSRVSTLNQSSVFAPLRENPQFKEKLAEANTFISETVTYFDSSDRVLLDSLDTIDTLADQQVLATRQMAALGLSLFVNTKEEQRAAIATRTGQLAAVIATLLLGLLLALLFLFRMTKRAISRGNALQTSAARINAIVETALDGIIVADHGFRIVDFSPSAEQLFGLPAARAIGQQFFSFVSNAPPPKTPRARRALISKLLAETGHLTQSVKRQDGTEFPAEIAFERARVPDGTLYTIVVRDISARLAAEQTITAARDTALENERMKSDFLATMSHEIRTPLNGLMGNMELLRDTNLSAPQSRYIANMESSSRILMRHINDVLDITKYDAGKMKIAPRPIHLPTLFDDILATLDSLAAHQRTEVNWTWEGPTKPWICVDPDRYAHILLNIVGNAIKFTEDGQVNLVVECIPTGDDWTLTTSVTDTGPGISPGILPRVFDDFVTGDAGFDRNTSGTGLGLSIAKRFAEGLGGDLEVTDTSAMGTTFLLSVPVALAAPPENASDLRQLDALPSLSILIVEDNQINRVVVREMLESDGHRVTEAINGRSGVQKANETRFDVILMDISMPVLDGCAAAQKIKEDGGMSADSPIVALTANARPADQVRFKQCGMIATITKPLTRAALRSTLRELVSPPTAPNASLLDITVLTDTQKTLGPVAFESVSKRIIAEVETFLDWFTLTPLVDQDTLADRAHKLTGSAALIGANRMIDILNTLEDAARDGDDLIALTRIRPALVTAWTDTKAVLQSKQDVLIKAEEF